MPDEKKLVTTIKLGSGYEAPWLVFHTDTPEEVIEMMNLAEEIDLAGYVVKFAQGAQLAYGGAIVEQKLGGTPVSDNDTETDMFGRTWTFNVPGAPTCQHGAMVLLKGTQKKTGKPYSVYACSNESPRGRKADGVCPRGEYL